jgi:PRC-barrel domain
MTIRDEDVATVARGGGEVRTTSGEKIGNIGQIYTDDESGHPSWVTVKTGLFGTQESFVPLGRAEADGVDVVVPYDKQTIKGAPRVETGGSLTPQEEKRLFAYYYDAQTIDTDPGRDRDLDRDGDIDDRRTDVDRDADVDRDTDVDRDADGDRDADTGRAGGLLDRLRGDDDRPRDDQRDENDLADDAVGSPRLRRYVVTEKVVPVSREEVPVDDPERP